MSVSVKLWRLPVPATATLDDTRWLEKFFERRDDPSPSDWPSLNFNGYSDAVGPLLAAAGVTADLVHGEPMVVDEDDLEQWGYRPPGLVRPDDVRRAAEVVGGLGEQDVHALVDRLRAAAETPEEVHTWRHSSIAHEGHAVPDDMKWMWAVVQQVQTFTRRAVAEGEGIVSLMF